MSHKKSKTILITGASSGFGRDTAERIVTHQPCYGPSTRCTAASAFLHARKSPTLSATRARAMPRFIALTFFADMSPSFSSAAAIEAGVGCMFVVANTPSFAVGPAAALASSLASMRACIASI